MRKVIPVDLTGHVFAMAQRVKFALVNVKTNRRAAFGKACQKRQADIAKADHSDARRCRIGQLRKVFDKFDGRGSGYGRRLLETHLTRPVLFLSLGRSSHKLVVEP